MDKKKVNLTIDGNKISVPADFTIMQAADAAGVHIPRLCYHPKLSAVGACRICIVEVDGSKNFPASCVTVVSEGMNIKTNSPAIRDARRDLVELILDNHPRECQICEKNNSCELQLLALTLGIEEYEFPGERKHFASDFSSASIVRDPDKCILCGKCVRVCAEIQGVNALSLSARGYKANVGPAYDMSMKDSVCINCGQCTLVCPTAALTEKDGIKETFKNLNDPNKVCVVQIAPAVRVAVGEAFGFAPGTDKTYEMVTALRMMGFKVVFDTQFSADLTIIEEGHEFIKRLTTGGKLPMFTSCSPGWIKYLESFHPEFIENVSTCKSPQQMMGALIKTFYAKKVGIDPAKIFSVSIMPCTAKKYECARPEMKSSGFQDVDVVLTTRELAKMIKQAGIKFEGLKPGQFDGPMGESTGAAPIFGVTGGVMEAALRTAYEVITKKTLPSVNFKDVRGLEGIKEAIVDVDGTKVSVAVVNGLANVHKLLTEIKEGKRKYHFVEVMTCPGGCIGGGGQPYPQGNLDSMDKDLYFLRSDGLYDIDEKKKLRKSHENPLITAIYEEFLQKPLGELSHKLLHTHYHLACPKGVPSEIRDTVNIG